MRNFALLILCCISFLGVGIAYGYVLGDAPHLEKTLEMEQRLHFRTEEANEYRKRVVAWSHYAWNLEHDNNEQSILAVKEEG